MAKKEYIIAEALYNAVAKALNSIERDQIQEDTR